MGKLYSITGLFNEFFPGISPWGGYFILGREGEPENKMVGQLIDLHGPSRLEGTLELENMKFRKQYERCNEEQIFDYQYTLEKNGIWKGEYVSPSGKSYGRSICKTNVCLDNLDFKKTDLKDPDEFARILMENMLNSGMLGSDFINPN